MKKLVVVFAIYLAHVAFTVTHAQPIQGIANKQQTQQVRIANGVLSGELTPRETARLEMRQAKIQHDKRLVKRDGVVTLAERRYLRCEQRRAGRAITRQLND